MYWFDKFSQKVSSDLHKFRFRLLGLLYIEKLSNCRSHKYDHLNFTNYFESNFWRDFNIWLYCVAVVLLLHQSGFCPLCRKAPKIPKTCCSQTTEKSLTLFMAPILTLTARPLPAPDPSGTMSGNNFCWRSSLNFMLYYLLFHEI